MSKNKRQTRTTGKNSGDNEVRHSYTGPKAPAKVRPVGEINPEPAKPETKPDNKPESKPESKTEPTKSEN